MVEQSSAASRLGGDLPNTIGLETTLLLACARNRLDSEAIEQIKIIAEQEEIDWTLVVQRAVAHGLTPLLARNLERSCRDSLPVEIAEGLRDWLSRNRARNVALAQEVLTIVDALAADGIPAIPLKGPVLAKTIFGDLALRDSGDLDFLVSERQVSAALSVLGRLGYRSRQPLGAGQEAAYRRYYPHFELERSEQLIADLHWSLTPHILAVRWDVDGIWKRAQRIPFEGRSVLSLSPEDYLIFLCVHGAKHLWCKLNWICDIHEFLGAHVAIDWGRCLQRARRQGCERMVLLGFTLAEALLQTELPAILQERIEADPKVRDLAEQLRVNFFDVGERRPNVFEAFWPFLPLRERNRDKLLFCYRGVTTPRVNHLGIVSLPRFLWFLYIPIKIFYDYGWRPLARPGKEPAPNAS